MTAAGLVAFAGCILPLFFPVAFGMKKSIFIIALLPLFQYLCYVIFPDAVVTETPKSVGKDRRKRYIYARPLPPRLLGL